MCALTCLIVVFLQLSETEPMTLGADALLAMNAGSESNSVADVGDVRVEKGWWVNERNGYNVGGRSL
jgi:hypothetical protein